MRMLAAGAIPTADIGERLATLREHNKQIVLWRGDPVISAATSLVRGHAR